ncbi:hypothetical protein SNEBB_009854 [Seison nebaliae]|nr:hypothetical protein SNEBB_009854 [Seison nebaliae]
MKILKDFRGARMNEFQTENENEEFDDSAPQHEVLVEIPDEFEQRNINIKPKIKRTANLLGIRNRIRTEFQHYMTILQKRWDEIEHLRLENTRKDHKINWLQWEKCRYNDRHRSKSKKDYQLKYENTKKERYRREQEELLDGFSNEINDYVQHLNERIEELHAQIRITEKLRKDVINFEGKIKYLSLTMCGENGRD